jgi:hypothetical protein
LHKSGNAGDAIRITTYLKLTTNADVIGLLALALYQTGDSENAFKYWTQSLALDSDARTRLRNANNYLTAFLAPATASKAGNVINFDLPVWPQDEIPGC